MVIDLDGSFAKIASGADIEGTWKPILLTEEILIKAGFEWSIYHQAFHKEDFLLDINSLQNGGFSLSTFKRNLIIIDKLNFLHQLQNAFYSLTGEELTINL